MQDNKRIVKSCRLYVSISITPFFFDQQKKVAEKFGRWGIYSYFWGKKKEVDSHPQRREVKPENHSEGIITTIAVI